MLNNDKHYFSRWAETLACGVQTQHFLICAETCQPVFSGRVWYGSISHIKYTCCMFRTKTIVESCNTTWVQAETPQICHTLNFELSSGYCTSKTIYCCQIFHNPHTELSYHILGHDLQYKQLMYKQTYCTASHVKVEHICNIW